MSENRLNRFMMSPLYPWLVWGLGAVFFFFAYIARVSPSAFPKKIAYDFAVNDPTTIITMSGTGFLIPYVLMQLPVGTLVDRFGPHRLMMVSTFLGTLGLFVFANTSMLPMLFFSRFLLGFSAAFAFICALKMATMWFPHNRIGLLSALTQVMGMIGAAAGYKAGNMLSSTYHYHWREISNMIAFMFLFLFILVLLIVRDHPNKEVIGRTRVDSLAKMITGIKTVLSNPQSWYNAAFAGFIYSPCVVIFENWGKPYFEATQGFSESQATSAIAIFFIGWAIGGVLMGSFSDRLQKRKPFMYLSSMMSFLLLILVMYGPNLGFSLEIILLFIFGFINSGLVINYAVSGEINPQSATGMSIAFANMISVLIGACLMPIIQWFMPVSLLKNDLGQVIHVAGDYQHALIIVPGGLLICFLLTFFIRETHCKPVEEKNT